ncbi:winged helix-turn-helix transcriptional regulator [Candidatus Woesearchaeota archaeon]|nr:winged helix-turn-helix transcriptional regulator [Candidatus Woesearchaeota archaeon]
MVSKWYLISKIKSSSYRKNVLILLHKKEMTPRELEKEAKIKISHISRALKELSELGLVKCLTPDTRRSKIYSITKLGKDILKKL